MALKLRPSGLGSGIDKDRPDYGLRDSGRSRQLWGMLRTRALPVGFLPPCLPIKAPNPPTGANWIHEIKHDGYQLMARRDPVGMSRL
jgi:ATP-dependent DNA ligase